MSRSWWDNEQVIERFRDWLSRSREEAQAAQADLPETGGDGREDDRLPDVGLLQLVEAFTALRQELKLQTKGARGLEASVASALGGLQGAIGQFQAVRAREEEAAERAARPLVDALVALDEALLRGARAMEATHRQLIQSAPQQLCEKLNRRFRELPAWRRWLAKFWHARVQQISAEELSGADQQLFGGLMEGFRLIQLRLERLLQEQQIRRIPTEGRPVDPSLMTVVELQEWAGVAPETVIQELRPGYLWRDRVIRFAEVRATPARR